MNKVDWYGPNVWAWNPLAMRCTPVGAGCAHCWHQRMAPRLAANPKFTPLARAAWAGTGPPVMRERELDAPLRRKRPSIIAVQFMGDLFHESVSDELLGNVFKIICFARQHRFLLLSKRVPRMADHVGRLPAEWLAHVVAGVSASTQQDLDQLLPELLKCPAANRWLSLEPLLGPVDLSGYIGGPYVGLPGDRIIPSYNSGVDWVVVGAETGPGARPMSPDWARGVRDRCVEGGVPFYLKQSDADGGRELDGRMQDEVPW